jgi:hypothetical protein
MNPTIRNIITNFVISYSSSVKREKTATARAIKIPAPINN